MKITPLQLNKLGFKKVDYRFELQVFQNSKDEKVWIGNDFYIHDTDIHDKKLYDKLLEIAD